MQRFQLKEFPHQLAHTTLSDSHHVSKLFMRIELRLVLLNLRCTFSGGMLSEGGVIELLSFLSGLPDMVDLVQHASEV